MRSRILCARAFPKIAVNGWLLKDKAKGYDELRGAIEQLERDNRDYRARVELLQAQQVDMFEFVQAIMKVNGLESIIVPTSLTATSPNKEKSALTYKG